MRQGFSEPAAEVFASLTDRMRVPVWILDDTLLVVYANQHCQLFSGVNDLGRRLTDFPTGVQNVLAPLIHDSLESEVATSYEGWVETETRGRCYWKIDCVCLPDRLTGVIVNDWTGRRKGECELKRSVNRYQQLFEAISEGVCIVAEDGRFELANTTLENILGVEAGSLAGRRFQEFANPSEPEPVLKLARLSEQGQPVVFEYAIVRPDGGLRRLRISARPWLDDEDRYLGAFALVQDYTDIREAEQQLKASQERQRAFIDAIPDLIFQLNRDGIFIDYHAQHSEDLAVEPDAIIGRSINELLPPGLARLTMEKVVEALETGELLSYEYELAVSKGLRQYESRVTPCGESECLAVVRDITGRKAVEDELQASQERFQVLVESMPEGVAILDSDFRFSYVNSQLCQLLGYSANELLSQCALDYVDQPSEYIWIEGITRRQDDELPRHVEITLLARDGTRYITIASPAPIYAEDGQSTHSFAIFTDITAQKAVEQELRASEDEFRMVVDSSHDAIITIDEQGLIRLFNPAAQRMFSCREGIMIGQSLDCLVPQDLREKHHEFVASYFASGKPDSAIGCTLEMPALHGDGTQFPIELSLSCGITSHGRFVMAVVRDISERHQMQRALSESETRYRYIVEHVGEGIVYLNARPDGDMVCTFANPAAELLLGVPPGGLNDRSIAAAFDEQEYLKVKQELSRRAAGEAGKYETILTTFDGRRRRVVITAAPEFDASGRFLGSFCLLWDAGEIADGGV